ncbi:hypothetical protein PFISCL1PPCAC_19091, partial [Pristionchus fissidentatus]
RSLSLLFSVISSSLLLANAKVDFTYSTMYGIYDFQGIKEVPLPRCDSGCLIYASSVGYFQQYKDGLEPYTNNLIIHDYDKGTNHSIAALALDFQPQTSQKVPLEFNAGNIGVLNQNAINDKGFDVTLWVVDLAKARASNYEIYDPIGMKRAASIPSTTVTVIAATKFVVYAQPSQSNSFTARLVGFDNSYDNNPDQCGYAFKTVDSTESFSGFEFHVNGPIISINFNKNIKVDLKADTLFSNSRDINKDGFFSSPGYNGCARLGGDQVHRASTSTYHYSDGFDLRSDTDNYRLQFDANVDLADDHRFTINDITNGQLYSLKGPNQHQDISIPKTQFVDINYADLSPPQSFMVRYTTSLIPGPSTTTSTRTAAISLVTSSTVSTSSTTITPTTSGKKTLTGAFTTIAVSALWTMLNS